MLIGIDPLLTPELLYALAAMGHGDRIALVDANYPATRGRQLIRIPGADTPRVLAAVLTLLPIDNFVDSASAVMQVVDDPDAMPEVVHDMRRVLGQADWHPPERLERHAFYAEAEAAWAIVQTGERRFYGNIILTKGVIDPQGKIG